MFIDTHAHLGAPEFKDDADRVITRSFDQNVWMISPGYNYLTSQRAVGVAQNYRQGIYAAVGLHPTYVVGRLVKIKDRSYEAAGDPAEEEFNYENYKELARHPKVVAVGECGLDYYWKPKTKTRLAEFKERQKLALLGHLKLARELGLPLIMHCRMAHDDLLEIMAEHKAEQLKGTAHCFTGTWPHAEKFLAMGLYLGFNALIFKLRLDDIIEKTPLDRMLIETDSPDLTPPVPGLALRNEPVNVKYIAQRIAEIKNMAPETIEDATADNARKLFNI